jgi:transcriptional regulator with XRE-family HTH domain
MNGDEIRDMREQAGLSRPALGRMLGVDPSAIKKWERNENRCSPKWHQALREACANLSGEQPPVVRVAREMKPGAEPKPRAIVERDASAEEDWSDDGEPKNQNLCPC